MEMIYLIRPEHLNGAGRLFGGKLVEWMDELSALVAIRHCRKDVTTVAIDNLRFMCPAYQRDMVVLIGRITHVGTTSMEVRVDVYIEDMNGMHACSLLLSILACLCFALPVVLRPTHAR